MSRRPWTGKVTIGVLVLLLAGGAALGWWHWWGRAGAAPELTLTQKRMLRRAYDGAPPVIPHPLLGGACISCHTPTGRQVPTIGIAPPNPHLQTAGMSEQSRCTQCHVFQQTTEVVVANDFQGLRPPLHGGRLYLHAPPVTPHHLFMREDCLSCHAGIAAWSEVRCSHPDRARCLQCHAREGTGSSF